MSTEQSTECDVCGMRRDHPSYPRHNCFEFIKRQGAAELASELWEMLNTAKGAEALPQITARVQSEIEWHSRHSNASRTTSP